MKKNQALGEKSYSVCLIVCLSNQYQPKEIHCEIYEYLLNAHVGGDVCLILILTQHM